MMKVINYASLNAGDISASVNGIAIDSGNVIQATCVAVVTGTAPVGTLKLQASNDPENTPGNPTNWSDIPSASVAVNGVANYIIPKTDVAYQWVRAIYTRTSGTGAITATIKTIGF